MTTASGLAFWLSYVESRGGLWESSGDSTLVMIPAQLQRKFELPEEFAVTEHADVAREEGAALLGPGHPLLMAAAEDVLAGDDAGLLQLPAPAAQLPGDARLLERAREAFPVDHGRIDARGPAERSLRPVLRAGVLVTYTASADDRFQERAECWVDVPSRLELPGPAIERLRRAAADGTPGGAAPDFAALPPALAAAHRMINLTAASRCQVLAGGRVGATAAAERARAQKYYAEAVESLVRRHASADADRQALLAARMDSVRAEENRRLAEIAEKYTPQYDVRPYRLHLLHVPVLRLPVDVLRGARRFPLVLEWLLPAGLFAPLCCPGCGAGAGEWPLVAAKTHLGCERCVTGAGAASPGRRPEPAGPGPVPGPGPGSPARVGGQGKGPAPAGSPVREGPGMSRAAGRPGGAARAAVPGKAPGAAAAAPAPRSPSAAPSGRPGSAGAPALSRMGENVATEFWSVASQANLRALRRLCAPETPAAAAVRLHGTSGPATAVGLAPGERPESLTFVTEASARSELASTVGYLDAGHARYSYQLRWHPGTRLVAEVLPFGSGVSARLPSPRWLFSPATARMFGGFPEPGCELDPVAIRLWRKVPPVHGLPLTLRCLAAWWRVSSDSGIADAGRPSVLAAAIHRMIGYRAGEAGVTHDAIAEVHRVTAAESRAVTPLLQGRLRLSPQQPW